MEPMEAMTAIKRFVMEHRLPKTEIALFGVKCPYCGKSDRIEQLETPEELNRDLLNADLKHYKMLWRSLAKEDALLGICKFCLNVLGLDLEKGLAEPLLD